MAEVIVVAGMVWIGFMLFAMFRVLQLAPRGQKMRAYHHLSMWNFGRLRTDLGPAVEPHLKTMRWGAYAFLALFAVAIIAIVINGNSGAPS